MKRSFQTRPKRGQAKVLQVLRRSLPLHKVNSNFLTKLSFEMTLCKSDSHISFHRGVFLKMYFYSYILALVMSIFLYT